MNHVLHSFLFIFLLFDKQQFYERPKLGNKAGTQTKVHRVGLNKTEWGPNLKSQIKTQENPTKESGRVVDHLAKTGGALLASLLIQPIDQAEELEC